ncbi:hypothetical protein DAPPUDRAFT_237368 [Daphnia pulex]|uniref:Uncharacterized protein n=1 Tax=Daphnia pulex TaxID=6669 RepID=E9G3R3_DAPPU|nr:hypothetical protein DAPPUDRAFT_237368 [Daphnia pulex]|eukprot:EFX85935.1 hypothetical protein DAPPUDRAFT_237368 [Daphnia pulex]
MFEEVECKCAGIRARSFLVESCGPGTDIIEPTLAFVSMINVLLHPYLPDVMQRRRREDGHQNISLTVVCHAFVLPYLLSTGLLEASYRRAFHLLLCQPGLVSHGKSHLGHGSFRHGA